MDSVADWILNAIGLTIEQQKFLVRVIWVVFMTFHVTWVCGWLTVFGITPPFAYAQDVRQVTEEVRQLRKSSIEKDIIQIRGYQCKAQTQEAKEQFTRQLQDLIDHYVDLTKQAPWIPDCKDVQQ